jgi:hypothetical protein
MTVAAAASQLTKQSKTKIANALPSTRGTNETELWLKAALYSKKRKRKSVTNLIVISNALLTYEIVEITQKLSHYNQTNSIITYFYNL